jgi:hypothetical protein
MPTTALVNRKVNPAEAITVVADLTAVMVEEPKAEVDADETHVMTYKQHIYSTH